MICQEQPFNGCLYLVSCLVVLLFKLISENFLERKRKQVRPRSGMENEKVFKGTWRFFKAKLLDKWLHVVELAIDWSRYTYFLGLLLQYFNKNVLEV
jgi:hypothetical protein